jgi:hypothetical protein
MSRALLPTLPVAEEEEARDLLCRAQAALLDEQPGAARRSLRRLHELLVPALDRALLEAAPPDGGPATTNLAEGALSAGIGFLGLYRELPDIDVERERPLELLLHHAARAEGLDAADDTAFAPLVQAGPLGEGLAAQWSAIEKLLFAEPLPRSRWWRRLSRGAAGPLGDRARVQVVRGKTVVLDRPPPTDPAPADVTLTDLGPFLEGDRMTFQMPMPLPGKVAVLHAVGDDTEAELGLVLPAETGEDVPRRAHEVVEVVGDLSPVSPGAAHAMVFVFAPEVLPPGWVLRALRERRLPPGARAWLYRYHVEPAGRANIHS